jgi:hypothetical protein
MHFLLSLLQFSPQLLHPPQPSIQAPRQLAPTKRTKLLLAAVAAEVQVRGDHLSTWS